MSFLNLNILHKKFFSIALFFIFAVVISVTVMFSKNCCFCGDDFVYANFYTNEKLFDCLFGDSMYQHGGFYIGMFLCKFFSFFLPNNILHIHPSDFIGIGQGVIKGFLISAVLFVLSKFSVCFYKSYLFQFSILFFSASYLFFYSQNSNVIVVNYAFYRYVLSLLFFGVLILYVMKNSTSNLRKPKITDILAVSIFAFFLGTSIEMLFSITVLFFLSLMGWNIFCLIAEKLSIIDSKKLFVFNLSKNFYIPFFVLISAIILFTSSPGFKMVLSDRILTNISVSIVSLVEYINLYLQVCVKDIMPFICVLLVLFIFSFYFAIKEKEIKKVIFPFLLTISIFIFMFSLYFCGKSFDEFTRDRWYLEHFNLIFLFKMLILYPIFILVSYLFKNLSQIFESNLFIYIFSLIMISSGVFYSHQIIKNYSSCNTNTEMYELKMNYYKSEKMLRYYILKDQMPIIPIFPIVPDFVAEDYKVRYCTSENKECMELKCYNTHVLTTSYYSRIYNVSGKSFCTSSDAEQIFYKNGGYFSKEELEDIKFKRLFDKDFVLNLK